MNQLCLPLGLPITTPPCLAGPRSVAKSCCYVEQPCSVPSQCLIVDFAVENSRVLRLWESKQAKQVCSVRYDVVTVLCAAIVLVEGRLYMSCCQQESWQEAKMAAQMAGKKEKEERKL